MVMPAALPFVKRTPKIEGPVIMHGSERILSRSGWTAPVTFTQTTPLTITPRIRNRYGIVGDAEPVVLAFH